MDERQTSSDTQKPVGILELRVKMLSRMIFIFALVMGIFVARDIYGWSGFIGFDAKENEIMAARWEAAMIWIIPFSLLMIFAILFSARKLYRRVIIISIVTIVIALILYMVRFGDCTSC